MIFTEWNNTKENLRETNNKIRCNDTVSIHVAFFSYHFDSFTCVGAVAVKQQQTKTLLILSPVIYFRLFAEKNMPFTSTEQNFKISGYFFSITAYS